MTKKKMSEYEKEKTDLALADDMIEKAKKLYQKNNGFVDSIEISIKLKSGVRVVYNSKTCEFMQSKN